MFTCVLVHAIVKKHLWLNSTLSESNATALSPTLKLHTPDRNTPVNNQNADLVCLCECVGMYISCTCPFMCISACRVGVYVHGCVVK